MNLTVCDILMFAALASQEMIFNIIKVKCVLQNAFQMLPLLVQMTKQNIQCNFIIFSFINSIIK